ncbi:MAG: hypothetical protein ABFS32_23200, partial [Bacteroidota bacterium]
DNGLIQKTDVIYTKPKTDKWISFKSKFYAPEKALFGMTFSTYWINVLVIWSMTIIIAIVLYLDWLKKLIDAIDKFREYRMYIRKEKKEKKKNL